METKGIVRNITELNSLSGYKFPTDNGASFGVKIKIDDCEYTVIDVDDLKIGDRVVVTYLPKSKYILTIRKAEDPAVSENPDFKIMESKKTLLITDHKCYRGMNKVFSF